MRIAIFSDSLSPRVDGIAVAVQHLTIGLVESGHQVLLTGPGQNLTEGAEFLRLASIPTLFDAYPLAIPCLPRMDRAMRRFRPDVVSTHTVGPTGLLGLNLARRHGVRALFSWHTDFESYAQVYRMSRLLAAGSYLPFVLDRRTACGTTPIPPAGNRGGLVPASLRRASQWMSAICAPSQSAAEQVRRFGVQRPVYVMPADVTANDLGVGGAAAQRALRSVSGPRGSAYLLYVGRMSREKNLELLIEAFACGVRPPARLVMVGPANDSRTKVMLESAAAEMRGRIVLVGSLPRTQLGEIYRRAAAFVTPSLSETQCLCVSEAIVLGVPVLVVDSRLAEGQPAGAVRLVQPCPGALGLAMAESIRAQRSPGQCGTAVPPLEKLSLRFVAAAESAGSTPDGSTLRWNQGRWIAS